jgi:DNA-binding HxlR family transcriptional regulator
MAKGYGTFCPVAKASEVLAERWMLLVVRELLHGSRHFNDFRRGLPPMSPALITKRLQTLVDHGVVERRIAAGSAHRWEYRLTPAGEALRPIVTAIGEWGQRWVRSDLRAEELDPAALMWYVHRHFRPDAVPERRIVIHFDLIDQKRLRHWWLVLDGGAVELCMDDPGFDTDIEVQVDLLTLTQVYIGDLAFVEARKRGRLRVHGPQALTRDMHSWFARSRFADINPRPAADLTETAA